MTIFRYIQIVTAGAAMLALCTSANAQSTYKWVDENGVTHYGDSIPAEDARRERYVLNEHGVAVKTLPREKSEAERAAELERERQLKAMAEAEERARERDQRLLDTYLSVEEIADLRDRRILALEAQIGVTRHYMKNLQAKWEELEVDARKYNFPFSEESDLPPLPDDIAQHLIHTEKALAEHLQTVRALRAEQGQIRDEFARDMARFAELMANDDSDKADPTSPL